jgi:iron complex outermembrane recepter protein
MINSKVGRAYRAAIDCIIPFGAQQARIGDERQPNWEGCAMMTIRLIDKIALRSSAAALALVMGMSATTAQAQDAAPTAEAAPAVDDAETIVVTGSRIARPELEASTPVQSVSAEALLQQGVLNVSDALNELPAFGIGSSRANSNFTSLAGVATVSLRNLGDDRTLVLQDGRRMVAGIGGSSAVDLNYIPTDLIERVEVLTGGASAVYGSEAMAGVVNFIMKKDFEGVRLRAQSGITDNLDNPEQLITATIGKNFSEGRGNITFFGQYDNDGGLRSNKRKISANDIPFRSGFTPQGRFFLDDPNATPTNDLSTEYTYSPSNQLQEGFDNPIDGFNRNGERYISVPVERYLGTISGRYSFSDSLGVFFDAAYSKVKSNSRLEPLATDNSDAVLPDGTILEGLDIGNPFIPQTIRNNMVALGIDTLPFRKRMNDVFDRSNRASREYYRIVAGFEGAIADNWKWDAYYNYGKVVNNTSAETALRDRYYYALDAIAGPGGTVICRDAAARADGCAPFNPFGFNSVSPQAAAYITNNGQLETYDTTVSQQTLAANISGSVFTLPAGDVKIAAGVERRREKSSEIYDEQTQLGNTMGNATENTRGSYNVFESYLEVALPIISEKPFIEYLGIEGAVRYGDYSTVGSVVSWKAGGTWAPNRSLRFRGVYSVATRAPNISELFQGASQTFPTGLTDPCEGVTATSNRAQDDYCRSLPGIAATIQQAGIFEYDDNADRQSIEGEDSGNINLKEETAKTLTLGLVFTPQMLRGFSATVDYFDIRISDAVQLVPRQTTIDACVFSTGTSPLCDLIVREGATTPRPRTPGTVFQVDSVPVNAASIKTRGIDVAVAYNSALQNIGVPGNFNTQLNYTYLDKLTLQPLLGEPVENNRNQLDGDGRLGAGFKHKANLSMGYEISGFNLNWRINYLSKIQDTRDENGPLLIPEENNVGDRWYHDLRLGYEIGENQQFEIYAGIDNVFQSRPPLINQNGASTITGTETAADTYDPYGRAFYAGVTVKF